MLSLNKKTKVTCNQCHKDFISYENNFYKCKICKNGYRGQCKKCCNSNKLKHNKNNHKLKNYQKKYRDTFRKQIREQGRYKDTEQAYKDRANELRRINNKFKRIIRITGRMKSEMNKYQPIESSFLTETEMIYGEFHVRPGYNWMGSQIREASMLDQMKGGD